MVEIAVEQKENEGRSCPSTIFGAVDVQCVVLVVVVKKEELH